MKTSTGILIWIAGVAAAAAIAVVVVARIVMGGAVTVPLSGGQPVSSGTSVERSFDLKGFSGVSASGAWDITVRRGTSYSVVVNVPDTMTKRLDIFARGQILHVGLKPGAVEARQRMTAEITMPSLKSLQLSGANRASFSGFSGTRLEVKCSGAAAVTGSGGSYEDLRISGSGASAVKFRDLPAVNADVRLSGAGKAELTMQGGVLSGELSGAGNVAYWGSVSRVNVGTSGIASVSHR